MKLRQLLFELEDVKMLIQFAKKCIEAGELPKAELVPLQQRYNEIQHRINNL